MSRRPGSVSCGAWLGALALLLAVAPAHASIGLPYPFWYFNAAPGATFDTPTGIAFTPDGRLLVAEKRGRVYVVKDGTKLRTPLWQRENEVLNNGDKGLLSVAVDPDFAVNGYVYLLYTVDPDTNGVDDNEDAFGRLTRYQVSAADPNVVDYATRTILMGRVWNEGPMIGSITHTIGSLRWGQDKTLLVSTGDGAQFTVMDPGGLDAAMFGPGKADADEDIGAFRAQDITSLNGKILRLDKATGHGLPSNPFWNGDPRSDQSKVWAYGLRNPFRFTVRPGSGNPDPGAGDPGTVVVGDVGWETWEEISKASSGGVNFGWPCFEGTHSSLPYQNASPAHNGCGSVGTPTNPSPFTAPLADWHHADPGLGTLPNAEGNSAIGGVFYTGASWPASYHGRLIFGDYGYGWIRLATLNASDNVTAWNSFAEEAEGPVDMAIGPYDGDLYYVSILTGEVRRIHYYQPQGGNQAPTAVAGADVVAGEAPLTVTFTSAGSSDPEGDSLRTTWEFADGSGSFVASPVHTFTQPGTYLVKLTVDDNRLNDHSAFVNVIVNAAQPFPATATLDDFERADGAVGGSWVDPVNGLGGLGIAGGELAVNGAGAAEPVWTGATYGPNQEAYVRLEAVTANAPEQGLMLKLQGATSDSSHIRVRYDARYPHVEVATYQPGPGMVVRGAPIAVAFAAGDTLGARAYENGVVEVYRNRGAIGAVTVGGWPYGASGGRLGLALEGAAGTRLDDFGGGNFVAVANTAPQAIILSPGDSTFFGAPDTLVLGGDGVDAEEGAEALSYAWNVTLHHNTHQHPNTFTSASRVTEFVTEDHEDGTGVWYEIKLVVEDGGGLRDTARVDVFPEVNLAVDSVWVTPATPVEGQWATVGFRARNGGGMNAPESRWRIRYDGVTLAEADTAIARRDSVVIERQVILPLGPGPHVVRASVDTLGAVVETDESDNGLAITVVTQGDGPPPIADLAATATGNAGDGRSHVRITWSGVSPADTVAVYRRAHGDYPLYRAGLSGAPAIPASPAAALASGWTRTGVTASSELDAPPARGFWYYVAFVTADSGAVSGPSNLTPGTLDYILGDVASGFGACVGAGEAGDGVVSTADLSALGGSYGAALAPTGDAICLDVAPTVDLGLRSRPAPDGVLDFEDLVVYALNFEIPLPPARPARMTGPPGADRLSVQGPDLVRAGETFEVALRFEGSGTVHGLSAVLGWDAAVAEPIEVRAGALLSAAGGIALSPRPGVVDAAVLGGGRSGLAGSGDLAVVTFRALADGRPAARLAESLARDGENRAVALGGAGVTPPRPAITALGAAFPNPFRDQIAIQSSLASERPARLSVFDLSGRRVRTLFSGIQPAGSRLTIWDGRDQRGSALPTGVYVVRFETGDMKLSRRIQLIR